MTPVPHSSLCNVEFGLVCGLRCDCWCHDPIPQGPSAASIAAADEQALLDLARRGVLVGVEVFGANDCCEHGPYSECPADWFGLCDTFGPHSVGSDCNRAERWLMWPSNRHMSEALAAALRDDLDPEMRNPT